MTRWLVVSYALSRSGCFLAPGGASKHASDAERFSSPFLARARAYARGWAHGTFSAVPEENLRPCERCEAEGSALEQGNGRANLCPECEAVTQPCGHSACSQHFIDTGERACVERGA